MKVACDKCHGSGQLDVPEEPCGASVFVGHQRHERVLCWAERRHDGEPHMVLLCEPCSGCGGYDECSTTCPNYGLEGAAAEPRQDWWQWQNGDRGLTRTDPGAGADWWKRYGEGQ